MSRFARAAGGILALAALAPMSLAAHDIHSFARPERVRTVHADLDWTIDFDARVIQGSVTWTIRRGENAASAPLLLDTKDLQILDVRSPEGESIPWKLGPPSAALGQALSVALPAGQDRVTITYHTKPEGAGLQWLAPSQTAGGKLPFLFSQAQSILARTMLPCQDTPGVRITYTARVAVPGGIQVVMAARRLPGGSGGEPFRFEMPQPIPSYLLAIAAGDLATRAIGPRSAVWAEPSVVDRAAWEFADTEKMIQTAEALYGPYRWERYDILVLPPSFPFGGMENPRLTFATPTVLAGDRSLVSLVAHELAHSWSGNLVTNATWSDFWLNEGFTTYLERRIIEALYGTERATMEAMLGRQDLLQEMGELEAGFTVLHNTSLEGRDPDDAFSNVPYEKGYLFLLLLEQAVGRKRFDTFLRGWFDANAFQSRTTGDFEAAIRKDLFADRAGDLEALGIKEWLYEPGLPENAPQPHSDAFARAAEAARAFAAGDREASGLPGASWSTQEWLHFLRSLPKDLPAARMASLDEAFHLTSTGNSEILMQWLLQSIRSRYEAADGALEHFLTSQGRRKFLKPLYTELAKTPDGRTRALAIYRRARPLYHAISSNTIDGILHVQADPESE